MDINTELYSLLLAAKSHDQQALLELITKFRPLIKKYGFYLQYEDAEQDLTVALIEIFNQMPAKLFDGEISTSVFAALSYIKKAVKNEYIALSRKKRIDFRHYISYEDYLEVPESNDFTSDVEFIIQLDHTAHFLSSAQFQILLLKYYYGYSETEIARKLHISKQAISQALRRAMKKLLGDGGLQ